MRGVAIVLGFVAFTVAAEVRAKPTSRLWVDVNGTPKAPKSAKPGKTYSPAVSAEADIPVAVQRSVDHLEKVQFLGFSAGGEALAAFAVTVSEFRGTAYLGSYDVVRIVSTATEDVVGTFRAGAGSNAPEWRAARGGWETYRRAHGFSSKKLDVSKSAFRLAVDVGDRVTAEATKQHITVKATTGSGLGMTPVVRLYDGQQVYLGRMRVDGTPGRTLTAEVEAYHSGSGLHVAVLVHYTSTTAVTDSQTDIGRVFSLPGLPLGTTEIGAFNMTTASEIIGEDRFGKLNPGFEEPYVKWGRDEGITGSYP
jgi:hypothetical protein